MKTKPKSKITRLTVARLYNTGNYEHIRFEISAEVPKGGSAKQTLLDMGAILARLKPVKVPFNYEHAKEIVNKLPEQLSEAEKGRMEEFTQIVRDYLAAKALRLEALNKLDEVGGSSKHTDAKDSWDDDSPF